MWEVQASMATLNLSLTEDLKSLMQNEFSNKFSRALNIATVDASPTETLSLKTSCLMTSITWRSSTSVSLHASLMRKRSKCFVEPLHTWPLRLFRNSNTLARLLIFGPWASFSSPYWVDASPTEGQRTKSYTRRSWELTTSCHLKFRTHSVKRQWISSNVFFQLTQIVGPRPETFWTTPGCKTPSWSLSLRDLTLSNQMPT